MAMVGLNPMPLIPYPSSSGSSMRWPVISESCHVRADKSNQFSLSIGDFASVLEDSTEEVDDEGFPPGGGDLMPRGGGILLGGLSEIL